MNKEYWYFTFGGCHSTPNAYVKIYGTFSEARQKMINKFGVKWAFQYSEKEFKGQPEKYNLYEIDIG